MMTFPDAAWTPSAAMSARQAACAGPVSEDSADSFPASDPPSWSPLRVGSPAHDPRRCSGDP